MVSKYISCNIPQKRDENFKNPKIFYHAFFISVREEFPLLAIEDLFTDNHVQYKVVKQNNKREKERGERKDNN
jgi:hypothetical protein